MPSARDGRAYSFTWNNYTEEDEKYIQEQLFYRYLTYGREIGPIKKTKHLEGFVYFTNSKSWQQVRTLFKDHHVKTCNEINVRIKYCHKDGDIVEIGERPHQGKKKEEKPEHTWKTLEYDKLYKWQKKVVDICKEEPDDKTIYWFWEAKGGAGKTQLVKYIMKEFPTAEYCCATKSADILTMANYEKKIYLLNFARSQENFAPWIAIEQLKDGLISDSKLKKKCNNIIMDSPHIIVFANWPPATHTISTYKWNITKIELD